MPRPAAIIFDAYGTLLNVHAAMARHADRLGPKWQTISTDWRTKQIEYTWVRSLAGPSHHRDFWTLTQEALAWTAARHEITDTGLLADILQAYRVLDAYPEVPALLRRLGEMGIPRAILSNGEPGMLNDAVRAAGIEAGLDAVLSVEAVGVFKPDPRVYRLAADCFGGEAGAIAFVSSNPWDAFGAASYGFQVFWLRRTWVPVEYGLPTLATELTDLASLPDRLA
ncbi:MAG TPA: haloacid dehalogenase type II [Acetobacteraceae bacterium]|jgi:2-haloacid dehalogenase|nr:haloacid dehalogenase type II [Acetobacteraceae bacterium]